MKIADYTKPSPVSTVPPSIDDAGSSLLHHLWASIASTLILLFLCSALYPLLVWAIAQLAFPVQANGSLVKADGTYTTNDHEAVGSALLGQPFSAPQYFHPRPSAAGTGYDAANSSGSNLGPLSDKLLNGLTSTQPATPPATQPTESLAYDGIRLRTLHFALENAIPFKLYTLTYNPDGTLASKTPVPLSKFQDKDGTLNDTALIDAFPHPTDPADKTPLIASDFATPIPADAVTASASGLDPHISPENAALQALRVATARHLPKETVLNLIHQYTDQPSLGILGDPAVNVLLLNLALDKTAPMPTSATTNK